VPDPFLPFEIIEDLGEGKRFQSFLKRPPKAGFVSEFAGSQLVRILPVLGQVEPKMGFFSNLLNIGKRIIGGILGGGAAPAAAVVAPIARRVVPTAVSRVGRIGRAGAGLLAGGAVFGIGESIFAGDGGGGGTALAAMGGNGDSFRRTIVQTIRASDGVITRQEILRGGPHLMQHDLVVAKRVFRLASKLHAKMPRRTVRVSRQKMLMQQVVENALEQKMCPPALCPPKGC